MSQHDPYALPRLPTRATLAGVLLAACIGLPFFSDDDVSLLRLLIEAWHDDWLGGTLLALVIGAPHAFGAAIALSGHGGRWGTAAVKLWVTLIQAELVLFALVLLHQLQRGTDVRAPWVIIGFAGITAARFAQHVASTQVVTAPDHGLGFYARWGALLVVGVFAWFELNVLGHGALGLWLHGTLAAAFLVAAVVPKHY